MKIIIYTKEKIYNFKSFLDKNYEFAVHHAHKENGPAYIKYYDNNQIELENWYINGKLHREDNPAYISYYKNGNIINKAWFINGRSHRENGPCYIEYYGNGNIKYKSYYLNDKRYDENEFLNELLKRKLKLF